jgi:NAD(P)-dependent dehydrogenase (short-subunit alcohol dehydrogenase family)
VAVPDVSNRSIAELVSLTGRVAVVTGGSQGTGAGIVRRLAEAGAAVVITDGDGGLADDAARALVDDGHSAIGLALAGDDEASVEHVADEVIEKLGRIDIWVNNAGIYPASPVLEMTSSQWDEVLDANLKSAFLGSREAARRMIAGGHGGVIVNVGSTAGFRAYATGASHYIASKFGMRGLTQALAVELGPHRIRVLDVAPTFTVTPGTRRRRADLDDEAYEAYIQGVGATKPLGRVGVPDDVGRVVLFCVSDLAMFMTGSTLAVDAGDLAR